ncbi:MAG TPA: SDR family NAD(P)-dependent oxidoreductase, partial [Isosphaeraceae bacterium]
MGRRFEGRTVWISGAGSGIGAAAARLFAGEGATVAIVDLDVARSVAVCDQIVSAGGQALSARADVASEAGVRDSIAATVARFGGLHVLVNAAGIVHVSPLHEYDEGDWDRLMGVNVKGIFLALKHGLPHLRRHPRSYVVNVGSISSFVGQAWTPAYTTSKTAVLGLTRSIALDYAA